ncbi:AAA family ATPase [Streptomyces sp. NBC_00454]|uniref:AAA family ATPase n=1 Tax=Streptomyces sp. NBC_00454 TaxID=2975747 RepID=UPI0030E2C337
MRIAISGTYSTGKTTTSLAVAYLTGIPHTSARTMRQLLPIAVPGKRLQECTPAEIAQLGIRRFVERSTKESHLQSGFVSDGTSINEWVYGKIRVRTGIDPNKAPEDRDVEKTDELRFFEDMVDNIGSAMKGYAADAYDTIFHLPVEFSIVTDGHRPVSERFRSLSDDLLLSAFGELGLKYEVVSGTSEERLEMIMAALGIEPKMSIAEALALAEADIEEFNRGLVDIGWE